MDVLRWKHDRWLSEINPLVQQYLAESGYLDKVKWNGNSFSASVGIGVALNIRGKMTDDEIVIEKCGGVGEHAALAKNRESLQKSFPAGEVA